MPNLEMISRVTVPISLQMQKQIRLPQCLVILSVFRADNYVSNDCNSVLFYSLLYFHLDDLFGIRSFVAMIMLEIAISDLLETVFWMHYDLLF
jgi:hypothetical protein